MPADVAEKLPARHFISEGRKFIYVERCKLSRDMVMLNIDDLKKRLGPNDPLWSLIEICLDATSDMLRAMKNLKVEEGLDPEDVYRPSNVKGSRNGYADEHLLGMPPVPLPPQHRVKK